MKEPISYKHIKQLWSDDSFKKYFDSFKQEKAANNNLTLNDNLFIILVLSYIEEKKFGKEILRAMIDVPSLDLDGLPENDITKGISSFYKIATSIMTGYYSWKYLRERTNRILFDIVNPLMFIVKDLPTSNMCNYKAWRDTSKLYKEMPDLLSLLSKLVQNIINFSSYADHNDSYNTINFIYSLFYYIHDEERGKFSDLIFDIIMSENSNLRYILHTQILSISNKSIQYEIHIEFQEYCKRKKIKEKCIFEGIFQQVEKTLSQEDIPFSDSEIKAYNKSYYSRLNLDDNKTKKLFDKLKQEDYISRDTDYIIFHYRFSGKNQPDTSHPIRWLRDKKDLSYFIYRLTRTNITDEKCEETTTDRDFFGKTKVFFTVEGEEWKEKENFSDMAKKLSQKKKDIINKLLHEVLDQK